MINFRPTKLQMAGPEIFEALFGNLELIWRGKESLFRGTGWGGGGGVLNFFYITASLKITWNGSPLWIKTNKQTPKKENKRNWFRTNDGKSREKIANCGFFFCFT